MQLSLLLKYNPWRMILQEVSCISEEKLSGSPDL